MLGTLVDHCTTTSDPTISDGFQGVLSKAVPLTASFLSQLPGFESWPRVVRKLPATVVFVRYSSFLHHLQLASHEILSSKMRLCDVMIVVDNTWPHSCASAVCVQNAVIVDIASRQPLLYYNGVSN